MNRDTEILEICREVFCNIGLKRLTYQLDQYLEDSKNEQIVKNLYKEAVNWDDFSEQFKKRFFVFKNHAYSILKAFIISYQKDYNDDGQPVIVINKLEDESASFKDNPIKNLYIVYDSEEDRDVDFEKLLMIR